VVWVLFWCSLELFTVWFGCYFGVVWGCFGGYFWCGLGAILDVVFGAV